ncbi:MAG: TrkA family potassium uptake protein [Oscillospiraceae bacterium]|nr:TrkA family potassium uptake protein [Oscillospiraceae bacterium]
MKSFLIIGAGTFGHHLCRELAAQKCEVMVVDRNAKPLEDLVNVVTSAKIADCSNIETLRSFDIPSFDACFVSVGRNFQYSLEITSLLKELGAKKVFSKADEDIQAKFLLRIGADEVVYPEKDMAKRIAIAESSDSIFDCMPLTEDFGIYEINVPKRWVGKTVVKLDVRRKYNLSILALKIGAQLRPLPPVDHEFTDSEHLMVLGRDEDIRRVIDR